MSQIYSGNPFGKNSKKKEINYLTFTALTTGNIWIQTYGNPDPISLQMRKNFGAWQNWDLSYIYFSPGDVVQLKGDNATFSQQNNNWYRLNTSGQIKASGNIMSLVDSTCQSLEIPCDFCFYQLFFQTSLITPPEFPATILKPNCYQQIFTRINSLTRTPYILPATALAKQCYQGMFSGCQNMITTMETLPATELVDQCYAYMFQDCKSIVNQPEIMATSIGQGGAHCRDMFKNCTSLVTSQAILRPMTCVNDCYREMYKGCTSLSSAPELPATTMTFSCYQGMFQNCSSLINPPQGLPATNINQYSYALMFDGCSSLRTTPIISGLFLDNNAYQGMFANCSSLVVAPEICVSNPAGNNCMSGMFLNCTSLTTPPQILSGKNTNGQVTQSCYTQMFENCSSLVSAPELPVTKLRQECYQYMFRGCSSLTTAPELPATTLAGYCYREMFMGCSSLTEAPELPATTLANNCYERMFQNCTSLTVAPELPATTLATTCYFYMFLSCTNLSQITVHFTDWKSDETPYPPTAGWLNGVPKEQSRIFKCPETLPELRGDNYIPVGWIRVNL